MAKRVVVRKKKSNKFITFINGMAFLTLIAFVISTVFLRTQNTILMKQKQDIETQISTIEVKNEELAAEVQELRNYNRVVSIAEKAGLEVHKNTVIIKQGD